MLNPEELIDLCFTTDGIIEDEELKYKSYTYSFNDSYIDITFNLDENDNPKSQIFTFNDRELNGAPPTKEDLIVIINLM